MKKWFAKNVFSKQSIPFSLNAFNGIFAFFFLECGCHKKPTSHNNVEKEIDFFFLILANLCLLVYQSLSCAATIMSISTFTATDYDYIEYVELFYSIVPIIQSILQLYIVWILENKIKLDTNYLQVLTMLNFSLWLFDTFSVVFTLINPVPIEAYGRSTWKNLVTIFIPFAIFYRFHSCIVLIKIKAEKYSHDHIN